MKSFVASFLCILAFSAAGLAVTADTASAPVYELRIYYTHPGKMPNLLARFRDHTCKLFEQHGMVNVGYWLPVKDEGQDKLYYVLRHASRDAAKASWAAFGADPEWQEVAKASEAAGAIVAKVDSVYLAATDYSPAAIPSQLRAGSRIYELRTYTTNDGKLDALDARFRDQTVALFAKHGMTNVLYTHPTDAAKGAGKTLIYLLAHASVEAAKQSFASFGADTDWVKVITESEKDGPLLVQPPSSLFLVPTDFSALK